MAQQPIPQQAPDNAGEEDLPEPLSDKAYLALFKHVSRLFLDPVPENAYNQYEAFCRTCHLSTLVPADYDSKGQPPTGPHLRLSGQAVMTEAQFKQKVAAQKEEEAEQERLRTAAMKKKALALTDLARQIDESREYGMSMWTPFQPLVEGNQSHFLLSFALLQFSLLFFTGDNSALDFVANNFLLCLRGFLFWEIIFTWKRLLVC